MKMREITGHTVFEDNPIRIVAMDEPSASGCSNHYVIEGYNSETHQSDTAPANHQTRLEILFQSGPPPVVGFNGVTVEALLCVVADRLQGFQNGIHPHVANEHALDHIKIALGSLHGRSFELMKKK
jgi:hypothetical protein